MQNIELNYEISLFFKELFGVEKSEKTNFSKILI